MLDLATPQEALQHLEGLCWRGPEVVFGRKRPDGTARPGPRPPEGGRGPALSGDSAIVLDKICCEATGERGTYWNPECPSLFERLVETALRMCGPNVVSVRDLVRRHARWRADRGRRRTTPGSSVAICRRITRRHADVAIDATTGCNGAGAARSDDADGPARAGRPLSR